MHRSLLALTFTAAGLAAQAQTRVVPAVAAGTDGNSYLLHPFAQPPGPQQ